MVQAVRVVERLADQADVAAPSPAAGDLLLHDGSAWVAVDRAFVWTPTWSLPAAAAATGADVAAAPIVVPFDGTIVKAMAAAGTAPTGADLVFDLNLDGASLWATTPANRLKIAAGQTSGAQAAFDTPEATAGSLLTLDVDQVGSTAPGGHVAVLLVLLLRNR